MELVKGVNLHFVHSEKFKTNRVKVRFSAPLEETTIGARVLVASMLETANQQYPTSQRFREKLASLYGAEWSTSVFKRGKIHSVDLDFSFVRDAFLSKKNVLTDQMIDLLKGALFFPLTSEDSFEKETFWVEKKNRISDLEADIENHYYYAHKQLNQLYFEDSVVGMSKYGTVPLLEKENEQSTLERFHEMLLGDQIDIFFVGDFNEVAVIEKMKEFDFKPRKNEFQLSYQQTFSNVVREKLEQRTNQQSILELGYHFSAQYGDELHLPMIVLNGILGAFPHSKLFQIIREQEGLAYTISSHFDIFTGFLRVFAGIDRENRTRVMTLILRQLNDLKRGRFTEVDLQLTKEMLINSALLAQDRQHTLIERVYLKEILGSKVLDLETWMDALASITKEDVMNAAKQINLQSVYFMEGK